MRQIEQAAASRRPESSDRVATPEAEAPMSGTRSRVQAAAGTGFLLIFLVSLMLPVRFWVGSLLLSPDRLLLLVVFIPLFFRLVSGKAGPIQPVDILILLHCFWMALTLIFHHGFGQIQFMGMFVIEKLGGYLVGRTLVRSNIDYRAFFRYFTYALVAILPFVLLEQLTRRMFLSEILGTVFETYPYVNYDQRMGFNRVQAVFEHPILYGMVCSLLVGNVYYLNRDRLARALPLTGFAIFMTLMSFSSGPLLSVVLQTGLMVWEKVTRAKWKLLALLAVVAYVVVDLLSNRTPAEVLISYATFNQGTGYARILIWRYGMQNVMAHPILGIGFNEWARPSWMYGSFDNFWLLNAMKYGIPCFLFLAFGIAASLKRIFARRDLAPEEAQCRTAYVVAAIGLFFTLGTVHIWGSTSVLFMFYIGAGVWLSERGRAPEKTPAPQGRGLAKRRAARPDPAPASAVSARAPRARETSPADRPAAAERRPVLGSTRRVT